MGKNGKNQRMPHFIVAFERAALAVIIPYTGNIKNIKIRNSSKTKMQTTRVLHPEL
jgi:hypothetical protein